MASIPTTITFLLYIFTMILIGWMGYRATATFSDYILGGRRLGCLVTAMAAGASDMSGWLLMAFPGAIYLAGLSAAWIALTGTMGAWLNWRIVAPRLRAYTERCNNALTLPEYFCHRFNDQSQTLRLIAAFIILILFTLYCASGIVAAARLFENIFQIPYSTAIWAGALATIFYVLIGGFLAVSWTDTVQATLMVAALIVTPICIILSNGGYTHSVQIIHATHATATSLFGEMRIEEIAFFMAWGSGYFGQPHILTRFMAAESIATIYNARRISLTWMVICLSGAISVGFFSIAFFSIHPELSATVNADSELVFIEIAKILFNPWIAGILLAAILAAIMSTLSCQLILCSSTLTEDIFKTFIRRRATQKQLILYGRLMVLIVAGIAMGLARNPDSRLFDMVSYAWAGFGAAFGPVVILSLYWKRMTRNGAMAGMLTGALTVLIWKQFAWLGLFEMIPGFLLASTAIILVSLMGSPPPKSIVSQFDEVEQDLRHARQ